ncbi:MAG: hypothetical protein K2I81_02090 [Alphaproteobacteria bacterium]|nr:hypothetical protein [Alphaproteobacteria bacterium]
MPNPIGGLAWALFAGQVYADFIEGGGLGSTTNYSCVIYGQNLDCVHNSYPCYQILNFSDASVWGSNEVGYFNYSSACQMYVPDGYSVDAYCAFDESCGTILSPCSEYGYYCPNGGRSYTYDEVKKLGNDSMALAELCPLPTGIHNVTLGQHILSDLGSVSVGGCYLAASAGPYSDDSGVFQLAENCYY